MRPLAFSPTRIKTCQWHLHAKKIKHRVIMLLLQWSQLTTWIIYRLLGMKKISQNAGSCFRIKLAKPWQSLKPWPSPKPCNYSCTPPRWETWKLNDDGRRQQFEFKLTTISWDRATWLWNKNISNEFKLTGKTWKLWKK